MGARVKLMAGGRAQYGSVRAGGNFLSADDMRLHFGLGSQSGPVTAAITWPSGLEESVELSKVDRIVSLREAQPPR